MKVVIIKPITQKAMDNLNLSEAYLGEGYYYRVYRLDEYRVYKIFQPYWFSFRKIFNYKRKNGISFFAALYGAHKSRRKEEKALLAIKNKLDTIPRYLFANPSFLDGLDYIQDKVTVVEDVFKKEDVELCKNIIDQYVALQKTFWSYGLHDTTFKLQINYGIDRDNRLVCLDFGEFVYTQEEALKSIKSSKWLKRGSYIKWPDGPIKAYYTNSLLALMTTDNLSRYWNSNASLGM